MALCTGCTIETEIPDLVASDNKEDWGQIQKLIIQRRTSAGVTNWIVVATDNPELQATWTALFAAADSTKIQITPIIHAPATTPGGQLEFGGGNDTPNGIPEVVGVDPTTFEANFNRLMQKSIKSLKNFDCEDITIMMVNHCGHIIADSDDSAAHTQIKGFPVFSWFVGDKNIGGLGTPDNNAFNFKLKGNWSDNAVVIKPTDFNAVEDLVN